MERLDPVLHSKVRLTIMTVLVNSKQANFNFLKEQTDTSVGNLSTQIKNLSEAGYIDVVKMYENNYPTTICKVSAKGRKAFEKYVNELKNLISGIGKKK